MCSATAAGRLTLTADDTAPGQARTFLRHMHCRAHQTHVLDDALLLVSELVTNAVRHGAPPITMHVACDHNTGMTVRVSDTNPAPPTTGTADHEQESGRGVLAGRLAQRRLGSRSSRGRKGCLVPARDQLGLPEMAQAAGTTSSCARAPSPGRSSCGSGARRAGVPQTAGVPPRRGGVRRGERTRWSASTEWD